MNTLSSISPNFTTPAGSQDYMNSEKNLKRAEEKREEGSNKELSNPDELSQDEKRLVDALKARDMEVHTHEAAHKAVAGSMAGAPSYTYQQGPDGKMYAIGGQISISVKAASSPEEAIANAAQIIAAAMASSSPSPQDSAVASSARIMQMRAQQQLTQQNQEIINGINTYINDVQQNKEKKNDIDIQA